METTGTDLLPIDNGFSTKFEKAIQWRKGNLFNK